MTVKIGPASEKQAQFLASTSDITVFGGAAGCVDKDTEFMSQYGWKKISEYTEGDHVLQFNPETNKSDFIIPEYVKLPCEYLTCFKAKGVDQCLSDEHKVLYYNDNGSYHSKPFSTIKERHNNSKTKGFTGKFKTTFDYNGIGIDLDEGQLRLQVAVMADGRVVKEGKDNYTQMRFSKKRKYDRLLEMCKKYNLKYKDNGSKFQDRYSNNTEYEVIVWPKWSDKEFDSKYYRCSKEQLKIIFDEVFYWDGSFVENEKTITKRYFTKHKHNADFIQFVSSACGFNATISEDNREGKHTYTVNCMSSGKGFRGIANKDGKIPMVQYKTLDGYKYCFTVKTGFWVMRRNDKICVTGNSGKSYLGYMSFLPHINNSKFRGMVIRRTIPMISKPGAVADSMYSMYKEICPKVKYLSKSMKFIFPQGAEVHMGGIEYEKDKYNYQGSQVGIWLIDEGQQLLESQVVYLISRMRTDSGMQPKMLITCNPDTNSYLRYWLQGAGYLDENNYGIPHEHLSNVEKYFIRQGNDMIWRNTREELLEEFGEDCGPMSFRFISATCEDNPILLERDPSYISKLKNMPRIEMMRLLKGAWLVNEESSGYFKREWITTLNHGQLPNIIKLVRAYDLAGSIPSEAYPDPDWTVGVLMGIDDVGNTYILDVVRYRERSAKVLQNIIDQAKKDTKEWGDHLIIIPEDAGAAGKTACDSMVGAIQQEGYLVRKNKMSNVKGRKLKAFQPFAISAENNMVYVMKADWNTRWFDELEQFDPSQRGGHDDQVDATADSYNAIVGQDYAVAVPLPTIDSPTMCSGLYSSFGFI